MIKTFLIIFGILASLTYAEVRIEFKKDIEMMPGVIYLKDISEITGDENLVEKLSWIEVGKIKNFGGSRTLNTFTLKKFFINPVVDLERIDFHKEGKVKISTVCDYLYKHQIDSIVTDYIKSYKKEGDVYEITLSNIPAKIKIPKSGYDAQVHVGNRFDAKGREMVHFKVSHEGRLIKKISVSALVKVFEDVVFTKEYVKKGVVVKENDLEIRNIDVTNYQRPLVKRKKDLVGKVFKRTMPENRMIYHSYIDEPYLVEKGKRVKLKASIGSVGWVYTYAIARENGKKGDIIRAQNVDSKKMINALVGEKGILIVQN